MKKILIFLFLFSFTTLYADVPDMAGAKKAKIVEAISQADSVAIKNRAGQEVIDITIKGDTFTFKQESFPNNTWSSFRDAVNNFSKSNSLKEKEREDEYLRLLNKINQQ